MKQAVARGRRQVFDWSDPQRGMFRSVRCSTPGRGDVVVAGPSSPPRQFDAVAPSLPIRLPGHRIF